MKFEVFRDYSCPQNVLDTFSVYADFEQKCYDEEKKRWNENK